MHHLILLPVVILYVLWETIKDPRSSNQSVPLVHPRDLEEHNGDWYTRDYFKALKNNSN